MLWFFASITMTVTCTVPEGCAKPPPRGAVVLVIGREDPVLCRYRAEGGSWNMVSLEAAARTWLKRPVRIRARNVLPKCVSNATGALQRAGHEDYFFID